MGVTVGYSMSEYPKKVLVAPQFDLTQKIEMTVNSLEEIKTLQKHRYEVSNIN